MNPSGPLKIGYICFYKDEPEADCQRQVKIVKRARPHYLLYDWSVIRRHYFHRAKRYRTVKRPGLNLLMRGLMPNDIIVIASIDRLGVTAENMADGLLMLRQNEIRVMDMDPDGTREWRPAVERTLAAIMRYQEQPAQERSRIIRRVKDKTTHRGVGWMADPHWPAQGIFEPHEGQREVCRAVVRLRESGMEFADIAAKLTAEGVLYVGVMPHMIEAFTAELAEECYLSAKADFPYPTPVIQA